MDKLSNWTEIPPTPNATLTALWHVGGQESRRLMRWAVSNWDSSLGYDAGDILAGSVLV